MKALLNTLKKECQGSTTVTLMNQPLHVNGEGMLIKIIETAS